MKSYAQQPQLFAANGRCIYQAIQRSRVGHLPEVVDASCCTGREVVFNLLQTGNMLSTINNLARCLCPLQESPDSARVAVRHIQSWLLLTQ